jgi:hypothetical protein
MSLPYPHEVETGQLRSRRAEPRLAYDVRAAVERAIRSTGTDVEIFGVRFVVDDPMTAESLVERYRDAVSHHLSERVSAPDADIWQTFAEQAHDQVEQHTRLDDHVLEVLRLTIDNL